MTRENLWTVDDVASFLKVSPSTVRRLVRDSQIPSHKAGVQLRFDPSEVQRSVDGGLLSRVKLAPPSLATDTNARPMPPGMRSLLSRWRRFVEGLLADFKPSHVIVLDRRGAKAFMTIGPWFDWRWGQNLWHSTALRRMSRAEIRRLFSGRRVLVFDEMIQHGREMEGLRHLLEQEGAIVTTAVLLRRRSHVEQGLLRDPEVLCCDDLDDREFGQEVARLSDLLSHRRPPLDVDHVVVRGRFSGDLSAAEVIDRLSPYGFPFTVWEPLPNEDLLAVTLDRPLFFDTSRAPLPEGLKATWNGPCKIRYYFNTKSGDFHCSFIAFPMILGVEEAWTRAVTRYEGTAKELPEAGAFLTSPSDDDIKRTYVAICTDLSIDMLRQYVESGLPGKMGTILTAGRNVTDLAEMSATFGPTAGPRVYQRIVKAASSGSLESALFGTGRTDAVPGFVVAPSTDARSSALFECREALLRAVPMRYDPHGVEEPAISYPELFSVLSKYTSSTSGAVLDSELDAGTVGPTIRIGERQSSGLREIVAERAFWRGEFGAWYEWARDEVSSKDDLIRKLLVLAPNVIDQFQKRLKSPHIKATHFSKLFANLSHDWRPELGPIYLGWRPDKFGPVPTVPSESPPMHLPEDLSRFLLNRGCISRHLESHGTQRWPRYAVDDSVVPWRELYTKSVSGAVRSYTKGLIRLYAAIQLNCKAKRPSAGGSDEFAEFSDPLVVLGAVRNQKTTYICGRYEVDLWLRRASESLFPTLAMWCDADTNGASVADCCQRLLENFAQPPRLLEIKLEMYANLPSLRQQIVDLILREDFDLAEVLLESVDEEPRFTRGGNYPTEGLRKTCSAMRRYSSLVRQILMTCGFGKDTRPETQRRDPVSGTPKDAAWYLQRLVTETPELLHLQPQLTRAIELARSGKLKPEILESLRKAFDEIATLIEREAPEIPDLAALRAREDRRRGELITLARDPRLPDPGAVAVVEVRNLLSLANALTDLFGESRSDALEQMQRRLLAEADTVALNLPGLHVIGSDGDCLIIGSEDPNTVIRAVADLQTNLCRYLGTIDHNQLVSLALLRTGVAWRDSSLGSSFSDHEPALVAISLAEKLRLPAGTTAVSLAVYERLDVDNQSTFAKVGEGFAQLATFTAQGGAMGRRVDINVLRQLTRSEA